MRRSLPSLIALVLLSLLVSTASAGPLSIVDRSSGLTGSTPPRNVTPPSITGQETVGGSLAASTGVWSGKPTPKYSFAWLRCDSAGGSCAEIAGATASTFTLSAADAGKTVRVAVTATNKAGSATAVSDRTAGVTAPPTQPVASAPAVDSLPAVSGTETAGQTLTGSVGTWSGTTPMTFSFQWRRCDSAGTACSDVAGATSAAYAIAAADVGATLRLRVTATNAVGSARADSAATGIVTSSSTSTSTPYFSDDFTAGTGKWLTSVSTPQGGTPSGSVNTATVAGRPSAGLVAGANSFDGTTGQLTSLWLSRTADRTWLGAEGQDVWYRLQLLFPSDYQPTTGEWNFFLEWHNNDTVAATGVKSAAFLVQTDYPVSSSYGANPRLKLRWIGGPTTSPTTTVKELPPNSLQRGRWYDFLVHVRWSTSAQNGLLEWYLDGSPVYSGNVPTLQSANGVADTPSFGLYNYRLKAPWEASIRFADVRIGPTRASVGA